jgi:hypothetical protein
MRLSGAASSLPPFDKGFPQVANAILCTIENASNNEECGYDN